jgi:cupin domain
MPPVSGFGPPLHIHHREDEAFYLLDGAMQVVCGEDRWEAGPGSLVMLPRGVPHAFVVSLSSFWGNPPIRRRLRDGYPARCERAVYCIASSMSLTTVCLNRKDP